MQQYVLITGASGGIGLELAKIFASKGNNLILVARSENRLLEIASKLKAQHIDIIVVAKDLSVPNAATELINEIHSQNNIISILINNAGFGDYGPFSESPWKKDLEMLNLNIIAITELTKLVLPGMIERKEGKILNVASTAGFMPGPLMSVYFATKAYVINFSVSLASELQNTGVSVTVLCPGATHTGFSARAGVEKTGLFNTLPVASSFDVAKYAYVALMKGKTIAVHGFINKLSVFFMRFTPRKLAATILKQILK